MGNLTISETPIKDLNVVSSRPFKDHRGQFMRCFCSDELSAVLQGRSIAQINSSRTETIGAIRGLHFQLPPHAEMKLVRCTAGRIFDVAVDIRSGSPTFLQWYGLELTPENRQMLVVPEGFAHGFQVLEPASEIFYLTTCCYNPEAESGIRHDDPAIGITWPAPVADLSERDGEHDLLSDVFEGITV